MSIEAEKVISWGNIVASGGIHPDEDSTTMTVFLGAQSSGRAVEVRAKSNVWYGRVDEDGYAIVVRSDLLPTD